MAWHEMTRYGRPQNLQLQAAKREKKNPKYVMKSQQTDIIIIINMRVLYISIRTILMTVGRVR